MTAVVTNGHLVAFTPCWAIGATKEEAKLTGNETKQCKSPFMTLSYLKHPQCYVSIFA